MYAPRMYVGVLWISRRIRDVPFLVISILYPFGVLFIQMPSWPCHVMSCHVLTLLIITKKKYSLLWLLSLLLLIPLLDMYIHVWDR